MRFSIKIAMMATALLVVSGCQSTGQRSVDQALQEFEYERDAENRLSKAIMLAYDSEQAKRKEAVPLLVELLDQPNVQAKARLALSLFELEGRFGYVDDARYRQYHAENLKLEAQTIKDVDERVKKIQALLSEQPQQSIQVMNQAIAACEQPIADWHQELTGAAKGYLYWDYAGRCMRWYSRQNSSKRLAALAAYNKLMCSVQQPLENCYDQAIAGFAKGSIVGADGKADAAAVDYIASYHLENWTPQMVVGGSPDISNADGRLLHKTFVLMRNKDYTTVIDLVSKRLTASPALAGVELVLFKRVLALAHMGRNQGDDPAYAVQLLEESVAANVLDADDQWRYSLDLYRAYLLAERYQQYLNAVVPLLEARQEKAELVPPATLKKLKAR